MLRAFHIAHWLGWLLAASIPVTVQAQGPRDYSAAQLTHDATSLRGFHGRPTPIRRSFRSDGEARSVLGKVLAAAGLAGMEDRILLRASAQTANAEATLEGEQRLVFYNVDFMQRVREETGDYWSLVAILAHEVGHHVRLHTVIAGRNHEFELEADYQAGFIMRRMGASREQALLAYRTFPETETDTHPGRSERVQSVTLGWVDGGATHGLDPARGSARQAPAPSAPPVPAAPPATTPHSGPKLFRKSATGGGKGGETFDEQFVNHQQAPITGLSVTVTRNVANGNQRLIGRLQVQWGDVLGPVHGGGPADVPTAPVKFVKDEKIQRIVIFHKRFIWPDPDNAPVWVSGLQVRTTKGVYTFGDADGTTTECVPASGEQFIGFFGRAGSYIDQLGCLFSKPVP